MASGCRAIFSGFDEDFHLDVIAQLSKEHDWSPVYIIGNSSNENVIRQKYPDTIFHSDFDACRGIFPQTLKDIVLEPLDKYILEKLSYDHFIALKMMDRMDPGGYFNSTERTELFYNLARYWITILKEYTPDIVVFHLTPHLVYDYILYSILKMNNIRTLIFNYTSVNDLIYTCERFENDTPIKVSYDDMLNKNCHHKKINLSRSIDEYVKKVRGNYSEASPFYVKSNVSKEQTQINHFTNSNLQKIIRLLKEKWEIAVGITRPFRANYLKRKGKDITDSAWTVSEYKQYKNSANKFKRDLQAYYNQIAVPPNFEKQYIYAPLQYQPEKTTSPEAGVFVDQFLMVDMLSKSIPDNWIIYIKEHPSQFYETWHGERSSKNREFYDKLLSLQNVSLVDLETQSFNLIDNSMACCTTTGTAGWESILRGKPVLVFGHPWYRGCEGVFQISLTEDCRGTIEKIALGYELDKEKVKFFLMAMERTCVKGYVYGRMKEVTDVPYQENINRIVSAILKHGEKIKKYA